MIPFEYYVLVDLKCWKNLFVLLILKNHIILLFIYKNTAIFFHYSAVSLNKLYIIYSNVTGKFSSSDSFKSNLQLICVKYNFITNWFQ